MRSRKELLKLFEHQKGIRNVHEWLHGKKGMCSFYHILQEIKNKFNKLVHFTLNAISFKPCNFELVPLFFRL